MNRTEAAAYVNAQAIAAQIEAMGMQGENQQRAAIGASMAYDEMAFYRLIDKYGISHNGVLTIFGNAED